MIVGRFAPSPTGAQHLGNARTYLLAYWAARHAEGRLIFRVEDVDSPRVKSWAVQQSLDDLRWLGLDWDEGPDIGGPRGPYQQTKRVAFYEQILQRLRSANRIYPCTCTRKDIEAAGSAPHFDHEPAVYPGTCSRWRVGDPVPDSGTYSWRFRLKAGPDRFNDRVLGPQICSPMEALGDFPVTQKSGSPSYQLAVVVDDLMMGITEVVRGNDLIASTFRQLQIFEALSAKGPTYAHVPLVLGGDGRRLAKRHGDTRLATLREQGVKPHHVITWAARSAGLVPEHTTLQSAEELISRFQWSNLNQQEVVVCPETFGDS